MYRSVPPPEQCDLQPREGESGNAIGGRELEKEGREPPKPANIPQEQWKVISRGATIAPCCMGREERLSLPTWPRHNVRLASKTTYVVLLASLIGFFG